MKNQNYLLKLLFTFGLSSYFFVACTYFQQNSKELSLNRASGQIKTEITIQPVYSYITTLPKTEITIIPVKAQTQTPTLNLWQKRIPIPYDETHWRYISPEIDVLQSDLGYAPFTVNGIEFVNAKEAWILSNPGLFKFEKDHLKLIDLNNSDLLLDRVYKKLRLAPDGNLWFGYGSFENNDAENWISSWNTKKEWNNYRFPGKVIDIAVTKKGIVWVAYAASQNSEAGISYYQDGTWHRTNLEGSSSRNNIYAMTVTLDGVIWLYSENKLISWDGVKWQDFEFNYKLFNYGEGKSEQKILCSSYDGSVWGSNNFTIFHWNGTNWGSYYGSHYSNFTLGGIAISKDGKIWSGDGFIKDGKNYYFTEIPKYSLVYTIKAAPNDEIWYGTYNGILIYDNKQN